MAIIPEIIPKYKTDLRPIRKAKLNTDEKFDKNYVIFYFCFVSASGVSDSNGFKMMWNTMSVPIRRPRTVSESLAYPEPFVAQKDNLAMIIEEDRRSGSFGAFGSDSLFDLEMRSRASSQVRVWFHDTETIFVLLVLYEGNPSVTGFPSQRVNSEELWSCAVVGFNELLNKQSR